jgi:hypothetical protein
MSLWLKRFPCRAALRLAELNVGTMDIGLRFSVNKAEEIIGGKIIMKKNSRIPFFSFGKGGRLEAKRG